MKRIIGPEGKRHRLALFGAIFSVFTALALIAVPNALAVHDIDFQLDGNTVDDAASTQAFDWESFFNAQGQKSPALPDASRPGFTDSGFTKDFSRKANGSYSTVDTSTFATGSKDTLSISPGWQCNKDNNVNDKIDITNAYAVSYTAPATIPGPTPGSDNIVTKGDQILYFALERFSNAGDANVAFWFLQGQVSCVSTGGNKPFVGDHHDGDILVVSAFTNGGVVSTIDAYKWVGDDSTGGIDPTPIAHGVDCKSNTTPVNDTTCATVNTSTIDPLWDNVNKSGSSDVQTAEFFEGGLNVTKAGLTNECFSTFTGDTRSSQSLTATLFDYALGQLGTCKVSMTTTPSETTRKITDTNAVTDTADVVGSTSGSGTAPTPTGTVSFFLCGPNDLTNGVCSGTSGTAVQGNPKTVTQKLDGNGNPVPSTATATSGDASPLITGLGKYCFRATFTADPNDQFYSGQTAETDNLANECFTVTGKATMTTAQTWVPNDSATVTGDANLNGTLTFNLYNDGTCGADGGTVVYGPESFTFTDATSPQTKTTTNGTGSLTPFTVNIDNDATAYSWKVSYTDSTLSSPTDSCESTSAFTIVN
jgi:hypothetical protein